MKILSNLVAFQSNRVNIIFDTYPTSSIKDYEHSIRKNGKSSYYVIEGPETKSLTNFLAKLKNIYFKQAFVKFLIKHWSMSPESARIIGPNKEILLNYESCYKYKVVVKTTLSDFLINHEEADTKIV